MLVYHYSLRAPIDRGLSRSEVRHVSVCGEMESQGASSIKFIAF